MFEFIFEEQDIVTQLEIDSVAKIPAFLRFLRLERNEVSEALISLPVTPDEPNDFMVNHAILQSRKNCIDELIRFLEERREAMIEKREEATAN